MKKIFLLFFLLAQNTNVFSNEKTIKIILKINENIITNQDIIKESKYLKRLNQEITNIPNKQLIELAKNSLIRETVKQQEIEKFFKIDYESNEIDPFVNQIMSSLNLNNEIDFRNYLFLFLVAF